MIKKNAKQGIALITVLLITAITAIISGQIINNQNRTSQRTVQLINSDQGILSIWSIENFAKIYLVKDLEKSQADFPGEDWTIQVAVPIDGGSFVGKLVDETAKYNINNIINKEGKLNPIEANRVYRLLQKLDIENAGEIISAIIDWMDKDTSVYRELRPHRGAEDNYYTTLEKPYRTANRPLLELTELRLVKGMNPKIYNKVKPFLTALPTYTPINANFAKSEVIAMLDDNIQPDAISEILRRQNKKLAFQSHSQLIREIQTYALDSSASNRIAKTLTANVIDVKTQYFRLNSTVYLDKSKTRATSILYRKNKDITVKWRSFGLWEQ
jgi:general secretion pathway protein K